MKRGDDTKLEDSTMNILKNPSQPWIKYLIAKKSENRKDTDVYFSEMIRDERIKEIFETCEKFHSTPLKRHNDAAHPIHKLSLLLDFGFDKNYPRMDRILNDILVKTDEKGYFTVLLSIPEAFSKKKFGTFDSWILCDFPTLIYCLQKGGYADDLRVKKAVSNLEKLADSNGWRCRGDVAGFRGPGKKEEYCPYANIISLRVFSFIKEYHDMKFIKNSIDSFFSHWLNRKEKKYYMFGIGTDFGKLKYPDIWFDTLNVCRVLNRFDYAKNNPVFSELLESIRQKQLPEGGFKPESVYMAYKKFDFGQKKFTSETLTYFVSELFE